MYMRGNKDPFEKSKKRNCFNYTKDRHIYGMENGYDLMSPNEISNKIKRFLSYKRWRIIMTW